MELLPYEEFSALRLAQFLPPDAEIDDYECDRQTWRCEYHDTFGDSIMFCFVDNPPTTLSGIGTRLDDGGLPVDVADAILRVLRMPVDMRATREELLGKFGKPEYAWSDDASIPPRGRDKERDFLRFNVGSQWPYKVGFKVRLEGGGLTDFWIARMDFWVADEAGEG